MLPVKKKARQVKQAGIGDDTILAHISPEEALELSEKYGVDFNPTTGLPQFGLFRKLEQKLRKPFKTILPIALGAAGTVIAGPVGGMIGGAIGNAVTHHGPVLKNAGKGAMIGGMTSMAIPAMTSAAGSLGASAAGKVGAGTAMGGMGSTGLGRLGSMGSMGGMGGGAGAGASALPGMGGGAGAGGGGAGGFFGNLLGGLGKDPLSLILGGTALGGTMFGLSKQKKERKKLEEERLKALGFQNPAEERQEKAKAHKEETEVDTLTRQLVKRDLEAAMKPVPRMKPVVRRAVPAERLAHTPLTHAPSFYEDVNPEPEYYAKGGYVKGSSGGQTDDVKTKLRPKSYVWDATTVSLIGDGNSDAGAKEIKKIENKFLRSGIVKLSHGGHRKHEKPIKAMVSTGEYISSPEFVTAFGRGNNDMGAKLLDKMRNRLRQHKGVGKFLPPKSKPLESYVR